MYEKGEANPVVLPIIIQQNKTQIKSALRNKPPIIPTTTEQAITKAVHTVSSNPVS